jgi:hypothetical protein
MHHVADKQHLSKPYNTLDNRNAAQAYLPDTPPQVLITCRHNVALVLPHALAQAVISICALVRAGDALNSRILQDDNSSSREPVLIAVRELAAACL